MDEQKNGETIEVKDLDTGKTYTADLGQVEDTGAVVDGRAYYSQAARRRLSSDIYHVRGHLGELGMTLTAVVGTDDDPRWLALLNQVATVHVALEAAAGELHTEEDDIPF